MRRRLPLSARVLVVPAILVLAGCGQKGPLYLPEKGGGVVTAPGAAPPPAPVPSGQPPARSPAPQPQSTPEPTPPPAGTPPTEKKSGTDEDPSPK